MVVKNGIIFTAQNEERRILRVGTGLNNDKNALNDESLQVIVLPSIIENDGKNYRIEEIGTYAFCSSSITKVFIPLTIKIIRNRAFSYCHNLKTVIFETGSHLRTIESNAFYDGYYREDLILNTLKLKTIGNSAFQYNAYKQKLFVIPENVVSINTGAIGGLAALEHLYYCGSRQFDSNIYSNGGQYLLPDSFEIHVTSKFKYDNFAGRKITENNYNGVYCPLSCIKTCKHHSCSRNQVYILIISFLIS